jgi:MFS family permease
MIFIYDLNMILSVVLLAISVATGTGGRSVFGGILAFKMRTRINTGTYTASLNSFAAIMAGVIPPMVGALIDSFDGSLGYKWSYLVTFIISVICLVVLFVFMAWYKKSNKNNLKTEQEKV